LRRRPISKGARSDLIWSASFFVALQLGLAIAGLYWWRELHDPRYEYKADVLHKRIAAAERPITTVMLGSSRAAFGLRGTLLEERLRRDLGQPVVAFNFGAYGAGPITELINLRRLLADGIRPDLLLIEVTPLFLAGQPGATGELDTLSPTRLWWDELATLEKYAAFNGEFRETWWLANAVPWYGYRFNIVSRIQPKWLTPTLQQNVALGMDPCGWAPLPLRQASIELRPKITEATRRTVAPLLHNFQLGGSSARALPDLLELCRSENLRIALVLMPESSEFRSWYPVEAQAQIQQFIERMSREYSAPLIDARDWVPDAGFSDGHHLLTLGANRFTERLGDDVLRMLKSGSTRPTTATTTARCP